MNATMLEKNEKDEILCYAKNFKNKFGITDRKEDYPTYEMIAKLI